LLILIGLFCAASTGQIKGLATRTTDNFRFRYDRNVRDPDIRKVGKLLQVLLAEYSGRLGIPLRRKVDVYAFSTSGRYQSDSKSSVYDDASFRDGKIYLNVSAVLKADTSQSNPLARVVSDAILNELKWCPRWVAELYGMYAGKDLDRFGTPAQTRGASFSDLTEDYARADNPKDLAEIHAKLAATVRFLVDRYGQQKVEQMYRHFSRPSTLDNVFESAFGEKMPVIEKAWSEALRVPPKG
jgi:hypothetical protein